MSVTEPPLKELRKIEKALFRQESTDENIRKLKAIAVQIKRHEKAEQKKKEQL